MSEPNEEAAAPTPAELIDKRIAAHQKAYASAMSAANRFTHQAVVIEGALQELGYLKRTLEADTEPAPE